MTEFAKRCFTENLALIGRDPVSKKARDPIQYNLNAGLLDLTEAIAKLQADLKRARHEIAELQRQLPR